MSEIEPNLEANIKATQRALLESELLLSLYRALIEQRDLHSGLSDALEIVCQFTGWVLGTAWFPCADQTHLTLCSFWYRDDPKLAEFIEFCQQQQIPRDVGIAGRVWQCQREEWTRNLAAEPAGLFPLAPGAADAELKAAFGVPVIHNHHIDGVLVFHARELKDEDAQLVETVSRIAMQLGFVLQHKELEEELLKQQALVQRSHEFLEEQVEQRTVVLSSTNQMLQAEIAAREQMEHRIQERVRQQEAVANIGRQALSGVDLSVLMGSVAELVARTLDVEFCKVLELLPGNEALLLRAGVGRQDGQVGEALVCAGTNSQAGYTLLCKEPVIVKDLPSEARFRGPPLLREHGVVSGVSVSSSDPRIGLSASSERIVQKRASFREMTFIFCRR